MAASGLASAGIQVARALGTAQVFLDVADGTFPQLSLAHTAPAGTVGISAGANPAAQFTVSPQAAGNSQVFSGPNSIISNVFQNPGTALLGNVQIANTLGVIGATSLTGNVQITGNTSITGSFLATGPAAFGNNLSVANTLSVPTIRANAITASGPLANAYVETSSNLASTTAALYLSPNWRVKAISTGGLAFQSILNGQWTNASVLAPAGASITIGQLTSSST